MYKRLFLYQHVVEPIRFRPGEASSLLDLILINEESMVSDLKYMAALGKSNHLQLIFNFNCYIVVKRHSFKKYQYCKTEENYEIYKLARNRVKAEMRKPKYTYKSDLASKYKTDPKLFWSYVRSKLKTNTSLSQLKLPCGTLTNDNNQKAGLLNQFCCQCL